MNRLPRPGGRLVQAMVWLLLSLAVLAAVPAPAAVPAATVRIQYNRQDGDAPNWQLYTWNGALSPSPTYVPAQPITGVSTFGVYYDVPIKATEPGLNFILHDANGNRKNCNNDMFFPFPADIATIGVEIWQLEGDCTIYASQPAIKVGDVNKAKAHFVAHDTLAWPGADPAHGYRLYYSATGGITSGVDGIAGGTPIALTADAGGLSSAIKAKFPHLAGALALKLGAADLARVPEILRGQMVVARFDGTTLKDATSLQIPGVLDDLYRYGGRLGALKSPGADNRDGDAGERDDDNGTPKFRVWAPTARSVRLVIYDHATGPATETVPMRFDARTGVWQAKAKGSWFERRQRKYYQYEVQVFVRSTGKVETNLVTDPYSLALSPNSGRSLVVDLDSPDTEPAGWQRDRRPRLAAPEDIVLYELHVRDFSASDLTVPVADRGKFRAFKYGNANGMRHLKTLSNAGLTHVHLLPAFDISSVPEQGCVSPNVPIAGPASAAQQAAIAPVRDLDCFNWGYDPVHYTVPEGSYASDPDGITRIVEFRDMVMSLHQANLRVVMDVVYNHTASAGQNTFSVLDKIVPDYYYRLDENGVIATSTCCQNTASEHAMMGKLLTDSVLTWARDYRVDGFRFDLMGFHPKPLLQKLKADLARIDPGIYLYGEGWNFGEVANNARFIQASQLNLAGSGIGTFSDRMRDGVRGGGPFDGGESLVKNQGLINGLWYDPNALAGPSQDWQRDLLLRYADWTRLGLAGTLKDYVFTDKDGNARKGSEIDYNGQPAGYVSDPQEVINYISAHDNQTLFDNNQFKLPTPATMADRVRVNNLGVAIVALAQGVPFFHAGDDILRSKSLDRDSYNSGDWFNRLDFTYQSNNWGVGLPPSFTGNEGNWSVMAPLLGDPALKPGFSEIVSANAYFRDMLMIRKSSRLFRLRSGADVIERVKFFNVGPSQIPGLIVMTLSDQVGRDLDPLARSIAVLFNADKVAHSYTIAPYQGRRLVLHPVQQASNADIIVKQSRFDRATGTFTVPPRTTAVFVEPR